MVFPFRFVSVMIIPWFAGPVNVTGGIFSPFFLLLPVFQVRRGRDFVYNDEAQGSSNRDGTCEDWFWKTADKRFWNCWIQPASGCTACSPG
jgi:hypothetical protein